MSSAGSEAVWPFRQVKEADRNIPVFRNLSKQVLPVFMLLHIESKKCIHFSFNLDVKTVLIYKVLLLGAKYPIEISSSTNFSSF